MAKKEEGKFRIKARASDEQIKKTRRKAALPRVTVRPMKTTPLIEFLMEHEKDGRTTRELVAEFREDCGHSFREIAYLPVESNRITFQVCEICGQFVKGKRGAKFGKVNPKKKDED